MASRLLPDLLPVGHANDFHRHNLKTHWNSPAFLRVLYPRFNCGTNTLHDIDSLSLQLVPLWTNLKDNKNWYMSWCNVHLLWVITNNPLGHGLCVIPIPISINLDHHHIFYNSNPFTWNPVSSKRFSIVLCQKIATVLRKSSLSPQNFTYPLRQPQDFAKSVCLDQPYSNTPIASLSAYKSTKGGRNSCRG